MLEKIKFENNIPYIIEVRELDGEEIHFHDDVLEAFFVIKGETHINYANNYYKIVAGQGAIITPMEYHFIRHDKTCIIAKLYFNPQFFELHKIRSIIDEFISFDADEEIRYIYAFRNLIVRILLLAYKDTLESKNIIDKLVNQIYQVIISSISQYPCYINSKVKITQPILERYDRILGYVLENFNRSIPITEVAEREHISETRLSHFWKSLTGLSFQNTVILLKMYKARELIISSDLSIQDISKLCGYSELRYFFKYFKEQYKVSPKEYRNQYLAALQHPEQTFYNRILSKEEAETYINQYLMNCYIVDNELPPNIINQEEILKEKALSNLFKSIQKNQLDTTKKSLKVKPIICNIPLYKNKGIYQDGDEYKINWEYVYIAINYVIKYGFNVSILIDYEIMKEELWHNMLNQFQEEVCKVWGKDLLMSFNCKILLRRFSSYNDSNNLLKRFRNLNLLFKRIEITYVL